MSDGDGGWDAVALCRWCGAEIQYRGALKSWIHRHGHSYCKHQVAELGVITSPMTAEPTVFVEELVAEAWESTEQEW